jgi:hypothetical protein
MSEDESRRSAQDEEAREVEAHNRPTANIEAGDEAEDDEVEAHNRPTSPDQNRPV